MGIRCQGNQGQHFDRAWQSKAIRSTTVEAARLEESNRFIAGRRYHSAVRGSIENGT
jgi:hypothetical protein